MQTHSFSPTMATFSKSPLSLSFPLPRRRRRLLSFIFILLIVATVYLLFPSDPTPAIVRVNLHGFRIRMRPRVAIDVSLAVTVRIKNTNLYSIWCDEVKVGVGYRGRRLGKVKAKGGRVGVLGAAIMEMTVVFDGVEVVFEDVVFLMEDFKKGVIPLGAVTEIEGRIANEVIFFHLPLKAKVSCELHVTAINQTIIQQNCYH